MTDPLSKLRIQILARFVSKAPGKPLSHTHLMMLCYFLQELKDVRLSFRFRLLYYGPYDKEVENELGYAAFLKIVHEEVVMINKCDNIEVTPLPWGLRLSEELEQTHPDIAKEVDWITREFAGYREGDLRLRALIFFVDRDQPPPGSLEELAKVVWDTTLGCTLEQVSERVRDMAAKGLLTVPASPKQKLPLAAAGSNPIPA